VKTNRQSNPRFLRSVLRALLISIALLVFAQPVSGHAGSSTNTIYAWGHNDAGQLGHGIAAAIPTPVVVDVPSGVTTTALAAGDAHSLAIGSDGKLYAWGRNDYGQLGDGTMTERDVPVVVSLPNSATATTIAAGSNYSLATGSDGKLYSWGNNADGQLGNGTMTAASTLPLTVSLPSGVSATAVAAGSGHSLAIGSNGRLYAWGFNGYGQLGDGTTTSSTTPVDVSLPGGVSATAIAAGGDDSLAIGSDGKLYAWGLNDGGQVGMDTTTPFSTTPVAVALPSGVTAVKIAAGYHNLALGSNGELYAWGDNAYGELGIGSTSTPNYTPKAVLLSAGVTALAGGNHFSLAIEADGKAYAWGENDHDELGIGTTTPYSTAPVGVSLPSGVNATTIAAGADHGLAMGSNGKLYAWGWNDTRDYATPVLTSLPGGAIATAIAAGYYHSLATGSDGTLYAWGQNFEGALGSGSTVSSATPVEVSLPSGVSASAIAGGEYFSLALGSDGHVYTWGENYEGELGNGTTVSSDTPVEVNLPSGVAATAIATSYEHALAIGSDGKLYAWGMNADGQLGDGTTTDSDTPIVVPFPGGVTPIAIAAEQLDSLALGSDGRVYVWGDNLAGQLGNDTAPTDSWTPVPASLPSGVTATAIAAGGYFAMAIGSNHQLYAWGENYHDELGIGVTSPDSPTPVAVHLPSGVSATMIGGGDFYAMAATSDGNVYTWGDNFYSELGDGTTTDSATPVRVNLPSGVQATSIAAGGFHALVITDSGVPTAVTIRRFTAARTGGSTLLRWKVVDSAHVVGFQVRANGRSLTHGLLAARNSRGSYHYLTSVLASRYVVQVVLRNGQVATAAVRAHG
jgi:alpha-tubulin suppressor-like RCC1 family protein